MIDVNRRTFIESTGAGIAYAATVSTIPALAKTEREDAPETRVNFTVNGKSQSVTVEDRTTLLDALRNQVGLTGTKKSCDRGECGACTVHVDGRRVLSCMSLAVMQNGRSITTIEGIANGSTLHPLQDAFIEHGLCGTVLLWLSTALVPRLGAEQMIALIMTGQVLASIALDHFGLAGLAPQPLNVKHAIAGALLIAGATLMR